MTETKKLTLAEILEAAGYGAKEFSNRSRSVRSINAVLNNSGITLAVCEKGKVWVSNEIRFNVKIVLPDVWQMRFKLNSVEPASLLRSFGKFLRTPAVKAKIYAEVEFPQQCSKCQGTGFLPHYAHIADGVCFDCMGCGWRGIMAVHNVQKKEKLTGRPYVQQFLVNGNYSEIFAKDVENIKAVGWTGHATAEQWLAKKDGIYYLHQPVCKANSWYAVPEKEFNKFQKQFKKAFNRDI